MIDVVTTNDINDQNQLYSMAKNASELLEIDNPTVIADTGYYNGSAIKNCIDDGMTVYIKKAKANNKTKDNEFRKEKFVYKAETDIYICPSGKEMHFFENTSKNGLKYRKYKCKGCESCNYKNSCTSSVSGRTLQRWEHEDILESVYADTWNNNDIYKQRRCIVEHPFGTVKRSLGYSYFLRREMENVDAEGVNFFVSLKLEVPFSWN